MSKYSSLTILFLLPFLQSFSSNLHAKVTLSGYVCDSITTERLIGASIVIENTISGTATNRYGFYSLTVDPGEYLIHVSFVGYKRKTLKVDIKADSTLNISLSTYLDIGEVTIKGYYRNPDMLTSTEIGTNMVSIDAINKTPVIAGETDVLKTLQFLPGIKQSQEGTSGINVRGGSPDQNLILLDGVPVYNVSHLFGFLSVFNPDALNHVKIYKGGIPARFGGRLSSILDISMKEGNLNRSGGTFSISPIAGRLTLEGPLKKDTASYIMSARRTFVDIPIRAGQLISGQTLQGAYYFYDYSGKMNWGINPQNRLYLSCYFGKDKYYMNDKEDGTISKYGYGWGNVTSVLRWNSKLSQKLFANTTAYFSHFYNKQRIKIKDEGQHLFEINSGLNDIAIASDFDWYPNVNHSIKFGIKSSSQKFSPQIIKIIQEVADTLMGKGVEYNALVSSVYVEDDLHVTKSFTLNAGFRIDWYKTGSKGYWGFQPRISGKYAVVPQLAVKASYTNMSQFLHLLSNTSIGIPTDLWVSSTEKVKPQKGWQVSTGIFYKSGKGDEFSVESYYKKMDHVIRLGEGESFSDSRERDWEDKVITGSGNAYGVELLYKKSYGRLTGMAGYALSWSNRKFIELNNGRYFPYRYDKRHDISILGEYKLYDNGIDSKSFTFGFTFNTGYAVSIPDIKHQGISILVDQGDTGYLSLFEYLQNHVTYSLPNNYRMPSFHHFDIGYRISKKLSNRRSRTWAFSIYNIYNRLNPWYYYYDNAKMKQVSIFPIIPSVSFTYSW